MRVKNLVLAVTATAAMLATATPTQVHATVAQPDVTMFHAVSVDIEDFEEVPIVGESIWKTPTVKVVYEEDDCPFEATGTSSWLEYDTSYNLIGKQESIIYGTIDPKNDYFKTFKAGYLYASKPEVEFKVSKAYADANPNSLCDLNFDNARYYVNGKEVSNYKMNWHEIGYGWLEPEDDNPYSVLPAIADSSAMYRLYNPNSGEHFYTSGTAERQNVIDAGWNYEGVGWFAPKSGTPVLRMYNPVAGEHHYTTSSAEADALVAAGWNLESDCAWYSAPAETGAPLYREYNPNQYSCNHNYTTSQEENDMLVNAGWQYEGIAWYGLK